MNYILRDLSQTKTYQTFIKNDNYPVTLSGLVCVAKSALISLVQKEKNKKILVITYNEIEAQRLIKDLSYFSDNVIYFPKKEISIYDYDVESNDISYKRIDVLNKMHNEKSIIVVTTIEAIMQKLISENNLFKNKIKVEQNSTISLDEIKEKLVGLGYERKPLVENRGEFSIRGDIIDVALSEKEGIRIEVWGDDVDSIRKFNIASQRSTEMVENVEIYPAKEDILETDIEKICSRIEEKYENVLTDIEEIKNGNYENKIDKYFNEFYLEQNSLLDYSKDFKIFVDEPDKVEQRINGIKEDNKNLIKELTEKERFVPEALSNLLEFNFDEKRVVNLKKADEQRNHFEFREVNLFKSELNSFENGIKQAIDLKKKIVILAGNKENRNKIAKELQNFLEDTTKKTQNLAQVDDLDNIILKSGNIILATGALSSGFENKETGLEVISSDEFTNIQKRRFKKTNDTFRSGEKIVFADLKVGDLVVHRNHGIAIFNGDNKSR